MLELGLGLVARVGNPLRYELYKALNEATSNQLRVLGYLITFIGDLTQRDLLNFLRFVTGSSVILDKRISVTFYSLSGLAHDPLAIHANCPSRI